MTFSQSVNSLRHDAISEIQRRIVEGEFQPGASFSESELVERLTISRAPVREALVVLAEWGWVRAVPRSGYVVSPLSLTELGDLFAVRAALEPKAAAAAAVTVASSPFEAEDLVAFSDHRPRPSSSEWSREHYRFHRRISVLSLNREIDRVLRPVMLRLMRYTALDAVRISMERAAIDHRPIVQALINGDSRAAFDATAVHVAQCQAAVTEGFVTAQSSELLAENQPELTTPGG